MCRRHDLLPRLKSSSDHTLALPFAAKLSRAWPGDPGRNWADPPFSIAAGRPANHHQIVDNALKSKCAEINHFQNSASGECNHGFCRQSGARRVPRRVSRVARSQSARRNQGRRRCRSAGRARPRDPRKAHRLAEEDARRRLGRHLLAQGIWRARRRIHAAGDLRRGIFPRPRPDTADRERAEPARPDPDPLGHRGTEKAPSAAHPQRRRTLVPGLFRAGRGRRPGEPQNPRRRPWRPFRRQRPEGVDLGRAFRRLVLSAGAHRPRRAQASRHHLSAGRHEDARASPCARWCC